MGCRLWGCRVQHDWSDLAAAADLSKEPKESDPDSWHRNCEAIYGYCFKLLTCGNLLCSVNQSFPTLCDPMDCSTTCLPVHYHLLELAQTHVHWVGMPSNHLIPLSSPSPPAFNFPSNRVFSSESALRIRWPKYWSFSISPSSEY